MRSLFACLLLSAAAAASPPSQLTVQGRLANQGGAIVDGSYYLEVSLATQADGSSLAWGPEPHPFVAVTDGLFDLALGDTLPIPASLFESQGALWVVVKVENMEALPAVPLRPVAWSLAATHAEGADTAKDLECDACVEPAELAFSAMTSADFEAHKASGDHDARYVNASGDTLIGALSVTGPLTASGGFSCTGCITAAGLADDAKALFATPDAVSAALCAQRLGRWSGGSCTEYATIACVGCDWATARASCGAGRHLCTSDELFGGGLFSIRFQKLWKTAGASYVWAQGHNDPGGENQIWYPWAAYYSSYPGCTANAAPMFAISGGGNTTSKVSHGAMGCYIKTYAGSAASCCLDEP